MDALSTATGLGLVRACHDCSEGGLAVAAAEMAFSGGLGMELFLKEVPYKIKYQKSNSKSALRNDFILFSESNSRFIVEVASKNQKQFERLFRNIPIGLIGCVSQGRAFTVHGLDTERCINTNITELKEAWQKPLRW